jgi:hypothetical protein
MTDHRQRLVFALALALPLLAGSPAARAGSFQWNGTMCRHGQNIPSGSSGKLAFSVDQGVINVSGAFSELLECGFAGTPATVLDVAHATIYYTDRSGADALLCYMRSAFGGNYFYWSAPRFSCGASGGCPTNAEPGFTGQAYLSWADPLNNGNAFIYAAAGFWCFLPGGVPGSTLHSYSITTTP